jgi:hypothetical protein
MLVHASEQIFVNIFKSLVQMPTYLIVGNLKFIIFVLVSILSMRHNLLKMAWLYQALMYQAVMGQVKMTMQILMTQQPVVHTIAMLYQYTCHPHLPCVMPGQLLFLLSVSKGSSSTSVLVSTVNRFKMDGLMTKKG